MSDFSTLISGTIPHHNKFSSRQGRDVTRVIQHHWAGMVGGDTRLASKGANASCTYLVYSDGTIKGQVPERFRPWTSGSFEADAPSITIEVQNSEVGGQWRISAKAEASLIRLLVDIAVRHKWGGFSAANYRGHREFAATSCPGPYLWGKRVSIRNAVHKQVRGGGAASAPQNPPTKGKSIDQLVSETLAGQHGNGAARKRSLGSNYSAVQAEVNRRLGSGSSPAAKAPKARKTVSQLADEVIAGRHGTGAARRKALGNRYAEVQAEVNRLLGPSRPKASSGPSISQLASAVIRGDYGNGAERKRRLGRNFNAVQAEVNRRLR